MDSAFKTFCGTTVSRQLQEQLYDCIFSFYENRAAYMTVHVKQNNTLGCVYVHCKKTGKRVRYTEGSITTRFFNPSVPYGISQIIYSVRYLAPVMKPYVQKHLDRMFKELALEFSCPALVCLPRSQCYTSPKCLRVCKTKIKRCSVEVVRRDV